MTTAITFHDYTGDGSDLTFNYTFPTYAESEVKVDVEGVTVNNFTIPGYATSGTKTVTFDNTTGTLNTTVCEASGAPKSGLAVRVYRRTNLDTNKATFSAGSAIKAADLNDNNTQVLRATQETQTQTAMSVDIKDAAIITSKIAADAVTGAKIADDQINSEHYVDGSIDTAHIADAQVTTAKIADSNVTTAKIADNAIDSDKIADNSVSTTELAPTCVTTAKIAADAVTNAKIADNSIDSEHYVDGSIDTVHLADSQVTTAKIADDAVTSAKIPNNAIGANELDDNAVDTASIQAGAITTAKILDSNVTTIKIADSNVTTAKIAADAITSAKIADDAVGTEHIADAELTTLAGMQTGTASILAGGTALTATLAEINTVVDGKSVETTISDTDAAYPTSGAVVDYVAAQIAPIGGLEVIATDAAFPNVQPSAGVVISIADAGGLVVNGSGTSTTGRTVGASTVTINNIASNFNSTTVDAGVAMMVSSTGSGQIYNYHKATLKEADLLSLSNDINDFANRYRVVSGEPGSNNDEGDLIYDTAADKMKVYDSSTSAFKEVTSTGDFKYLFLCPAGGTGAPTLNGSIATYDLRETTNSGSAASVTSAAQLLVSINGVVQKANTGTSAPAEGFALVDANTIIFGANLASGDSVFIVQFGSALTITTPGDNTVATAKLQNLSVTTAKIAADAVDGTKLADNACDSEHYTDGSIDHVHLAGDAVDGDNIADDSINSEHYVDGSIDTAHIADDQVTLAKMAGIARGKIIYGDASGNPAVLAPGTSGQVLESDGTDISWQNAAAGATGGNSNLNGVFWENQQTVTHNYTIQNNYNAGSFGPITINSGITVTVGAGESWTVI